jgi:hypothetical protein
MSDRSGAPGHAFLLTTSRSGSTLLRYLLEAHPEIACPPETDVADAGARLARSLAVLEGLAVTRGPSGSVPRGLSDGSRAAVAAAVCDGLNAYAGSQGKRLWCEKSLSTYRYGDFLAELLPKARFVMLTRHCLDVVASGVAADPWGVTMYEFGAFAASFPGNSVATICAYWLACTRSNLEFSRRYPDRCILVRYEDLVECPDDEVNRVFAHLGVHERDAPARAAFRIAHDSGYGDHEIEFTDRVHQDSVGYGSSVPRQRIPGGLVTQIDAVLRALDYRAIGERWRFHGSMADPRSDVRPDGPCVRGEPAAIAHQDRHGNAADRAAGATVGALDGRVRDADAGKLADALDAKRFPAGLVVTFVVDAGGVPDRITWWLAREGPVRLGDSTRSRVDQSAHEVMITADRGTWEAILSGARTIMAETEARRLRWRGVRDDVLPKAESHVLARALERRRVPAGDDG